MTMFRSQTDEMLAAKFDPEPYVDIETGVRYANRYVILPSVRKFDPRPEYIPRRTFTRLSDPDIFDRAYVERPEPNPILVELRLTGGSPIEYLEALNSESFIWGVDASPQHVEHARKVLTRLAALA